MEIPPVGGIGWFTTSQRMSTNSRKERRRAQHCSAPGDTQGRTDLGNDAYHGPCPGKGEAPHRYTFTIYALSIEKLDVPADSSAAMVVSTAKDNFLGKAVFIARYGR